MPRLPRIAAAPWLAGALLLALAAGALLPLGLSLGLRRWPFLLGLFAALLLLFGGAERLWQRRRRPRSSRALARGSLRVLPGGKDKSRRKGNGHAGDEQDQDGDEPRWLM